MEGEYKMNEKLAERVREHLEPDENLLGCATAGGGLVGLAIGGFLILLLAIYLISQGDFSIGEFMILIIAGTILFVLGLLSVWTQKKIYYYVTNKNLCIVRGKRTQTFPLETIQEAQKMSGGGRKTHYSYISVQLKDGNFVKLYPKYYRSKEINVFLKSLQRSLS
jgi:hypothetical protein